MTGTAADARETSDTAGHAARTGELATGAASDARDTALPARTAAGSAVLAARAAIAIGVAALPARVLLEDHVRRSAADGSCASGSFSCRYRHNGNRRSNGAANYKWFDEVQFCYHALRIPPTHVSKHFCLSS